MGVQGVISLRPYQTASKARAIDMMRAQRTALVVLPTGMGKTTLFCAAAMEIIAERTGTRALVLADRAELVYQAADRFRKMFRVEPEIEMGQEHFADTYAFDRAPVVVASKDSLHAKRIKRFKPDEFGVVIIDEADLATAPSYTHIFEYFASAWILGVTATPGDKKHRRKLGKVFKSVAYSMSLLAGIQDGWLVEPEQEYVPIESVDLRAVGTEKGDLNQSELAATMEYEKSLLGICDAIVRETGEEKTLVFASSVAHAKRMTEILNRPEYKPGSARFVTGETHKDERRQLFADYLAGRFQYLVNFGVTVRGFDDPTIRIIAMARPTESASLYEQMIGRGTRPLPGVIDGAETAEERLERIALSDKPRLRVLDFVGNSGTHKLMDVPAILGGEDEDEEVLTRARKALRERKVGGSVIMALTSAEREIAREKQEAADRAAEAARRSIAGKAQYTKERVSLWGNPGSASRAQGWEKGEPASRKQIEFLSREGVRHPERLTKREAGRVIGKVLEHYKKGWANLRQARVLKRFGYPVETPTREAERIISTLRENGWQRPDAVNVQRGAAA